VRFLSPLTLQDNVFDEALAIIEASLTEAVGGRA